MIDIHSHNSFNYMQSEEMLGITKEASHLASSCNRDYLIASDFFVAIVITHPEFCQKIEDFDENRNYKNNVLSKLLACLELNYKNSISDSSNIISEENSDIVCPKVSPSLFNALKKATKQSSNNEIGTIDLLDVLLEPSNLTDLIGFLDNAKIVEFKKAYYKCHSTFPEIETFRTPDLINGPIPEYLVDELNRFRNHLIGRRESFFT